MIKKETSISKVIDQKWDKIHDAVDTISNARNDLFDHVALSLSRIQGRLEFLNSESFAGEQRLPDFEQELDQQLRDDVQNTRNKLDKIFVEMTNGKNSLLGLHND